MPRSDPAAQSRGAGPLVCVAGEHFFGYRLQPGARLHDAAVQQFVHNKRDLGSQEVLERIAQGIHHDKRLEEALHSLRTASTMTEAQRLLGISKRSLERLVKTHTERPPGY